MFQFPALAPAERPVTRLQRAGLSHSETRGSKVICTSPRIIAAYRVLRRLREPRHPPCALRYFLTRLPSRKGRQPSILPDSAVRHTTHGVSLLLFVFLTLSLSLPTCQRSSDGNSRPERNWTALNRLTGPQSPQSLYISMDSTFIFIVPTAEQNKRFRDGHPERRTPTAV